MRHLKHAQHNEDLCRQLHQEQHFFDWMITTAFYSALHYCDYQLFPLNPGQNKYADFENYYHASKNIKDNKHEARKRLVYSNIDASAGAAYSWLKDNCWTARYYNYEVNELEAGIALKKLDILKSYFTKILHSGT